MWCEQGLDVFERNDLLHHQVNVATLFFESYVLKNL
jgi:hypothetical protein